MVDGTLDQNTKHLCIYSIRFHLAKYVKFDTAEEKWYSKNYPNDPSLIVVKRMASKSDLETEPEPEPEIQKMESMDEWRTLVKEKYWALKQTADDNFPGLWFSLEFQLSIKTILNIKNCTLPFIGIILGRPGSQKTVGIELKRKERFTYYTDSFSAKAFVSHSTAVSREQLGAIDMLPKIRNKLNA